MSKRLIIFLILFLLPIDNFFIGRNLLREAGVRPVNFIFIGLLVYYFARNRLHSPKILSYTIIPVIIISYLLSSTNIVIIKPLIEGFRPRVMSWIFQSGLLMLKLLFILCLYSLFRNWRLTPEVIIRFAIYSLLFHTLMFTLDYFYCYGIIREDYAGIIASPFREIHSRPTGLFSEPSYWGAFCGYMWPLCAICLIANYPFNRLLILCLLFICLVTPFIIRARTFIGILTVQLLFASFICKKRWFWFPLAIAALIFILPLFNEFQLFDIHENLSSAMRLGSTILGLNLSKEYGFFGLGLGQFTYFYSDKYAPDFLLYSEEAMSYFTGEALFRASTYNLFVRALVELGFLGFIGFTMLYFLPILYVYKNCYKNSIDKKKFWFLFLLSYVGAIAFQLTQDSLLYSPAIFFIAFSFSSCAQLKKAAFVR